MKNETNSYVCHKSFDKIDGIKYICSGLLYCPFLFGSTEGITFYL